MAGWTWPEPRRFPARAGFPHGGLLRAQRIERMIESAVRKSGKVALPKQRAAALFTLALSRYACGGTVYSGSARPVVDLRTYGVSGEGAAAGGATQELEQAVAAYMTEHKDANGRSCDRIVAMREVTRRNPELCGTPQAAKAL